jgi:hypothetical protein
LGVCSRGHAPPRRQAREMGVGSDAGKVKSDRKQLILTVALKIGLRVGRQDRRRASFEIDSVFSGTVSRGAARGLEDSRTPSGAGDDFVPKVSRSEQLHGQSRTKHSRNGLPVQAAQRLVGLRGLPTVWERWRRIEQEVTA